MIERTISQLANVLNEELCHCQDDQVLIKGISIDSRYIEKGQLYIPFVGQRVDGHDFCQDAIDKGASLVLWQKDHGAPPEIPCILCEDTLKALQKIAHAYLESLSCKTIGITGSNGKTSCKDILYSVLSTTYKTQKTMGNRNNEIGLPLTICELDEDCEMAILEMGMENFHEIETLCQIAPLDYAIITSIGSAHMENLGSKENIAKAKLEIVSGLKLGGKLYYNADHKELTNQVTHIDPSILCPFSKCELANVTSTAFGVDFDCDVLDHVHLNLTGAFQAMNALPVIKLAKDLGLGDEAILKGLSSIEMTKMRSNVSLHGSVWLLDDSYKSNPESAMAAIDTLMSLEVPVHIALLGDMLDLGPNELTLHDELSQYAKSSGVDILFSYGPLSKAMTFGQHFETKEELFEALKPYLHTSCAILVKGSRAMAMDTIVDQIKGELDHE